MSIGAGAAEAEKTTKRYRTCHPRGVGNSWSIESRGLRSSGWIRGGWLAVLSTLPTFQPVEIAKCEEVCDRNRSNDSAATPQKDSTWYMNFALGVLVVPALLQQLP